MTPSKVLAYWASHSPISQHVRRLIHSYGKGHVRVSDGGYGFLAVKPAFIQREDISFFMGVRALAGWPAGVYRGVVIEGKGELKI
jgi:hypothetical protein